MTPILTATPSSPPTYNPGMAETFSWIPILGADRPLFAQATYLTNASDITLDAETVNLDLTTTNSKLDSLTTIQTQKQNEIITLLNSVTAMAIQVDLNTDDLKINVDQVETLLQQLTSTINSQNGQNGFDFIVPGTSYAGKWTSFRVLSTAKFQSFGAISSNIGSFTAFEFPEQFTLMAPITSMTLSYGAVIAYK